MIRELGRTIEAAMRDRNLKTTLGQGTRTRIFGSWAESVAGSGACTSPGRDIHPENVLWIFSTARSGTTWLRGMLADLLAESEVWEEPEVGQIFGDFYERARQAQPGSADFVMDGPTRAAWTKALRYFVLEAARSSHPSVTPGRHLVVKEPGGAVGTPLLMEALPESRIVYLVRDPRDVIASVLNARKGGNRMYEAAGESPRGRRISAETNVNAHVKKFADRYIRKMGNGRRVFEAHSGPKALVRCEDLTADAAGTLRRVCSELGLRVDEARVVRVVARHAWERVSEVDKGVGRFHRETNAGGWKEDLTRKQAGIVAKITAPILRKFYP